jgi:hypothetical protein
MLGRHPSRMVGLMSRQRWVTEINSRRLVRRTVTAPHRVWLVALTVAVVVSAVTGMALAQGQAAGRSRSLPRQPHLVTILSPGRDSVVTGSRVQVMLAVPQGMRWLRVSANLHDVSRSFRVNGTRASGSIPAGDFTAGGNAIVARVGTSSAAGETHVQVFAGRRSCSLFRIEVRSTSPLIVTVRGPVRDTVFRALLNGRDVSAEFDRAFRTRTATLSATEGLRRGGNALRVTLARRSDGANDVITRRVTVRTGALLSAIRPIAGGIVGGRLRLDASPSVVLAGGRGLRYRWTLVRKPRGSHARIGSAQAIRARLQPDRPGRYAVRLDVRQRTKVPVAHGARMTDASGTLTRTFDVAPLLTPWGEGIQTLAQSKGGYELRIGSTKTANTQPNGYFVAFVNRGTGTVDCQAGVPYGQEQTLLNVVSETAAQTQACAGGPYLIVIAAAPTRGPSLNVSSTDLGYFNQAMALLGASVPASFIGPGGFSVIGIPNAPSGSAWENLGGHQTRNGEQGEVPGGIFGRLVPDTNSTFSTDSTQVHFELTFSFTGYVPFNTAQTKNGQTGIAVNTPTPTFAAVPSSAGPGGLQLEVLDAHTLTPVASGTYCIVAACASYNSNEWALANLLGQYDGGQDIIIIQTYGTVGPASNSGQGAVANQIRAMGGDPDLFNTFTGSYAFIYCPGHAPSELSGNSPTDTTAAFNGLFGRDSEDRWYQVQTALGSSAPNSQLPLIADAPSTSFPYQRQPWLPQVEGYLEGKLSDLGSDNTYCPKHDCLRALYWLDNSVPNWDGDASTLLQLPAPPSPSTYGCNPTTTNCAQDWANIRQEFSNEFTYVNEVTKLFNAWQGLIPLAAANGAYDLTALTNQIESFIGAAQAKQDQKNQKITEITGTINAILSAATLIGDAAGVTAPGVGAAINAPIGLLSSGVTAASTWATSSDGYPALQADVQAAAANLGNQLSDQFTALWSAEGTLESIILSDGAKLNIIGPFLNKAKAGWTWASGQNATAALEALQLSIRRYIYENLYRQYVFPADASHPKYPAYCAELGQSDAEQIIGTAQMNAHNGPGTNHAPHYHSGDAWYTFLITYPPQGGNSPLGVTTAGSYPDTSVSYPAPNAGFATSLFDTTGNNSTSIPASQFAYPGQPTNTNDAESQLFETPKQLPYVPPAKSNNQNSPAPPDTGGLGFNVSQFWWDVFQPYGTYTSSVEHTVGTC